MLLHSLLQEYLVENGHLPLSVAGQLTIFHAPARLQDADNTFTAPESQIVFSEEKPSEAQIQKLIVFIAIRLSITNEEAKKVLEKQDIFNTLSNERNDNFNWPELGLFRKEDEVIYFTQDAEQMNYLPSFSIDKVVRQPVSVPEIAPVLAAPEIMPHNIVGFEHEEVVVTKNYWWVWALVIFLMSAILILLRFS